VVGEAFGGRPGKRIVAAGLGDNGAVRQDEYSTIFDEGHLDIGGKSLEGLAQFDELVSQVMAEWRIPGLAMAVVRRDEPPLLGCWGVSDIETGAPVTPDTAFPICSVTKSFTATALALLADEGRLDWDAPVRRVLPEFQLRDAVASEQTSLRDLLTHRIGLPRHDWVHLGGHLDNAGMLDALRHLEPSKPSPVPGNTII
jgi:CubicO group peptidase (beta-lactamase class C family)